MSQSILFAQVIWNIMVKDILALDYYVNITITSYVGVVWVRSLKIDIVVHSGWPLVSSQSRLDGIVGVC